MRFTSAPDFRVHAVSLLIFQAGEFLLIERAQMPFQGWLSFPGGKVEAGEAATQAAERELWEETGLKAGHLSHLVTLDLKREGEAATPYFLSVYHGENISGAPCAGDDAAAICFLSLFQMEKQKSRIIPSVLEVARHFVQHGA